MSPCVISCLTLGCGQYCHCQVHNSNQLRSSEDHVISVFCESHQQLVYVCDKLSFKTKFTEANKSKRNPIPKTPRDQTQKLNSRPTAQVCHQTFFQLYTEVKCKLHRNPLETHNHTFYMLYIYLVWDYSQRILLLLLLLSRCFIWFCG